MLRKPLLVRRCVVVWVLLCGVFLGVAETIVGSPVCCYVAIVFLGVVESIVGWPVCCYAGIVLWSVSWGAFHLRKKPGNFGGSKRGISDW